jgi:ABC-2 type transport system ATP-binding protein
MLQLENIYAPNIDHLTLTVQDGECCTLFCHDSHTRKELCEILAGGKMAKGMISAQGIRIMDDPLMYAQQVCLLPGATLGLYPHLTVWQNILFFGKLKGLTSTELEQNLLPWMDQFNIELILHERVDRLILTQQQKAHFALGMSQNPHILILKDAFAFPSPELANDLIHFIKVCKEKGLTLLCVTEWLRELPGLFKVCDTVAVMHDKRLWRTGNPRDVLNASVCGEIEEAQLYLRGLQNQGLGGRPE